VDTTYYIAITDIPEDQAGFLLVLNATNSDGSIQIVDEEDCVLMGSNSIPVSFKRTSVCNVEPAPQAISDDMVSLPKSTTEYTYELSFDQVVLGVETGTTLVLANAPLGVEITSVTPDSATPTESYQVTMTGLLPGMTFNLLLRPSISGQAIREADCYKRLGASETVTFNILLEEDCATAGAPQVISTAPYPYAPGTNSVDYILAFDKPVLGLIPDKNLVVTGGSEVEITEVSPDEETPTTLYSITISGMGSSGEYILTFLPQIQEAVVLSEACGIPVLEAFTTTIIVKPDAQPDNTWKNVTPTVPKGAAAMAGADGNLFLHGGYLIRPDDTGDHGYTSFSNPLYTAYPEGDKTEFSLVYDWQTWILENPDDPSSFWKVMDTSTFDSPPGRAGHTMVASSDGSAIYLFGGISDSMSTVGGSDCAAPYNTTRYRNDLWRLDAAAQSWTLIQPCKTDLHPINDGRPPGRADHRAVWGTYNGNEGMFIFGGDSDTTQIVSYGDMPHWNQRAHYDWLNDLWFFNPSDTSWTRLASSMDALPPEDIIPGARYFSMAYLDGKIYVYGGDRYCNPAGDCIYSGGNTEYYMHLWEYDTTTDSWSDLGTVNGDISGTGVGDVPDTWPDNRDNAIMVSDGDKLYYWAGYHDENSNSTVNSPPVTANSWRATAGYEYPNWVMEYDPGANTWSKTNAPSLFAPPRMLPAYTVMNSKLYIFGGIQDNGGDTSYLETYLPFNELLAQDTWSYDLTGNTWTILADTSVMSPRQYASSAFGNGSYWVFGGHGGAPGLYNYGSRLINHQYDDLWKYDFTKNTGGWQHYSPNPAPSPRYGASMEWTGRSLMLFGGRYRSEPSKTKVFNDLWIYSPDSSGLSDGNWVRRIPNGTPPEPRVFAASVWTGEKFMIFGGGEPTTSDSYSNKVYNDVWEYDPENGSDGAWQKLVPPTDPTLYGDDEPCPRVGAAAAWYDGKLYVLGGFNYYANGDCHVDDEENEVNSNLWIFDPTGNAGLGEWTRRAMQNGGGMANRVNHSMYIDPQGYLYIVGGTTYEYTVTGMYNSVYDANEVYNGDSPRAVTLIMKTDLNSETPAWNNIFTGDEIQPQNRGAATMTWSAGRLYLAGGENGTTGGMGDLWTYEP
jgi:N-acetylneuraminic acid mutarotase